MGWSRILPAVGSAFLFGAPAVASAERVVYINLDATSLNNASGNDPTLNSHATTDFVPGTISGWPSLSDDEIAELTYNLYEATVPFDITFTFDRPASGTYDMIATGTNTDFANLFPALGGCASSIGLADCEDADAADIGFLFYGCLTAAQQTDMHRVAYSILTTLGFGWGLENLTGSGQIMASYSVFGLEFGNSCTPVSGASTCTHVGCAASQQNSTADLTGRVGARVDDGPPEVTILEPTDGTAVDGGTTVTIEAEILDKFGGLSAELEIVEAKLFDPLEDPPWVWAITLPSGANVWTVRVTGIDADGGMTTQEVIVCTDMPDCSGSGTTTGNDLTSTSSDGGDEDADSTSTTDEPQGSSSGEADASTTDPISPTAPIDPDFTLGPAKSGCHCRSGGEANAWSVLLLLVAAGFSRRPRRSRRRRPS
jgi:hypothetical protein